MPPLTDSDQAFEIAFAKTVGHEGDYSNHPRDRGGKTRFGITETVARAYGYTGEMSELPFEFAKYVYRTGWWDLLRLGEVASSSLEIACEIFDTAVNCGQATAGKFFQRALNVFNRNQKDYPDIVADGLVGAVTIHTLRAYLTTRAKDGETVMYRMLNSFQGAYYAGIVERDPEQESFIFGWLLNRVN